MARDGAHADGQLDVEGVRAASFRSARAQTQHLGSVRDDALREQETHGQVVVVPRGAHRDRQGLAVQPQGQRLLDGEPVRAPADDTAAKAHDPRSPRGRCHCTQA
jgi:hypothetical protein